MNYTSYTDQELELLKVQHNNTLTTFRVEYENLSKMIREVYDVVSAIQNEQDDRRIKSGEVDWEFLLEETGVASMQRHKTCTKELEKLSNFTVTQNGYFPELNQRSIRITYHEGDTGEDQYNALQVLLPYLKKNNEGKIYVGISEPTLSEFGIYALVIEDSQYYVEMCRYHQKSIKYSSDNIKDVLKYIQKCHSW